MLKMLTRPLCRLKPSGSDILTLRVNPYQNPVTKLWHSSMALYKGGVLVTEYSNLKDFSSLQELTNTIEDIAYSLEEEEIRKGNKLYKINIIAGVPNSNVISVEHDYWKSPTKYEFRELYA